jgi:hypothetical protein
MSNDPTVHNIIRLGKKNRPAPIGLAEWKDLVKRTPELRLAMEDEVLTNPFTNEPYRRTNHGDAEFRAGDDWVRLFRWQQGDLPMEADEGSISFRTLSGGEPAEDPVYQLALRLAEQLQARVFEDEP